MTIRLIGITGPSAAGKSTLAAWLVHRGWGFLTDEVAVLDLDQGRAVVQPFWRPIGVRHGGPLDGLVDRAPTRSESLVPASHIGRLGRDDQLEIHDETRRSIVDMQQRFAGNKLTSAALLRLAGVTPNYADLPEEERQRLLSDELANPRPLVPRGTRSPPARQPTLRLRTDRLVPASECAAAGRPSPDSAAVALPAVA